MKRNIPLLFLLWFCNIVCSAQSCIMYGAEKLSNNQMTDICQDKRGFIWIATEYGLNRFDGIQFVHYLRNDGDSASLLNNYVRSIAPCSDGSIWVGCINGMQRFCPRDNEFHQVHFPEKREPHVLHILNLHEGETWIATSGYGLYAIKPDVDLYSAKEISHINSVIDAAVVTAIFEDSFGSIWLGNDKGKVWRYFPATRKLESMETDLLNKEIRGIHEDKDGWYIISSEQVVFYSKKNGSYSLIPFYASGGYVVSRSSMDSHGNIYLGLRSNGLMKIDKASHTIVPYGRHFSLIDMEKADINVSFTDCDGNLWVGCYQKGMLMIPHSNTQFTYWYLQDYKELDNGYVLSMVCSRSGLVWVNIDGNEIYAFNQDGEIVRSLKLNSNICLLYEGRNNQMWVGSMLDGLGHLNTETGVIEYLPYDKKTPITYIVQDDNNNIYYSTFGKSFSRYNPITKEYRHWLPKDYAGLGNSWINSICIDSDGLVWLGHYLGVSCYDPETDKFLSMSILPADMLHVCYDVKESATKQICLATDNGLYVYDKKQKTVERFSESNGMMCENITGMEEDSQGNMWCSTYRGISKINLSSGNIVNYYSGDGLRDHTYLRMVASKMPGSGEIYFAGVNGITHFTPEKISESHSVNKVMLTGFYLNNQPISAATLSGGSPIMKIAVTEADEFKLAYSDNSFTLEFSNLDYCNAPNVYYEYKFDGVQSNWQQTMPGVNRVNFTHLDAGTYNLYVRACENGASSEMKHFVIRISPPWFFSGWACFIYILLVAVFILFVVKFVKRKHQNDIAEAKLQFFINISHEIRSPMTLIISPLDKLIKNEELSLSTRRTLQTIYRNASRILDLINQLLDVRKYDKGLVRLHCCKTDMVMFIQEIIDLFSYQSSVRNLNLVFEHSMDELEVWIDRNRMDKVLLNLLSNAFKYTPDNGEIRVVMSVGTDNETTGPLRHYVEISVFDTGVGLNMSEIERIFERFYQAQNSLSSISLGSGIGLHLCRILVEMHHGIISAVNRQDTTGSCFTVKIPLGKTHLTEDEVSMEIPADSVRPVLEQASESIHPAELPMQKIQHKKGRNKILIIDDDDEIANYLKSELEIEYKVVTCKNGKEGFQLALSQNPDLIVSDVMMPEMDGLTFVKLLKNNANISHIPVILLSAKSEVQDRVEGLGKGADAYLPKPFHIDELIVTINSLIANRSRLKGKFSGRQDQEDKVEKIELLSSDESLMERVMKVVNANLTNPDFNVEMLATEVGLSRTHLHRKLKELTGISASEFIRNIRFKQAARLLKEKRMNISQIAYAVGFSNQTHFSASFKKIYGVSPTDYIDKDDSENKE